MSSLNKSTIKYNMSFDDEDEGLCYKLRFEINLSQGTCIRIPNIYNSHRFKYKLGGYDVAVRVDMSDSAYMALSCPSFDTYDIILVINSDGKTVITYWYDTTRYNYNWSVVALASIMAIKDLILKYGENNE